MRANRSDHFKSGIFLPALASILLIASASCAKKPDKSIREILAGMPFKHLENYEYNLDSELINRVSETPEMILSPLREMDGVDSYESYMPNERELRQIEDCLGLLPALNGKTMKDTLLGIYFVDGFMGSGMADYVLGPNDSLYTILIFNPEALRESLSDWMTFRENSCFIRDNGRYSVEVDCGDAYTGFLYALLHESSHIVDMVEKFTPYTEPALAELQNLGLGTSTPFTRDEWEAYDTPVARYRIDHRDRISFYGLGGAPISAYGPMDQDLVRARTKQLESLYF